MNPATEAQVAALKTKAHIAFNWDFLNDLLKWSANRGHPVESLDQLTKDQASDMLTDLGRMNDPKRKSPFA